MPNFQALTYLLVFLMIAHFYTSCYRVTVGVRYPEVTLSAGGFDELVAMNCASLFLTFWQVLLRPNMRVLCRRWAMIGMPVRTTS